MFPRKLYILLFLFVCFELSFSQRGTRQDRPRNKQEISPQRGGEFRKVVTYLQINFPKLYVDLRSLQESGNRRQTAWVLRRLRKMHQQYTKVRGLDAETATLAKEQFEGEGRIVILAARYRNSSSESEREALRETVESLMQKGFELKRSIAKRTIQRLEEKIEENKERLNERDAKKDQIIERRLSDLLDDDLDW